MPQTAETDAKDLARGAGVNYLGYGVRLGARAPFLFIAALLYGETRFGEYVFGLTVVETCAALSLFGMKRSLFKFMSEATDQGASVHRAIATGIALAAATGLIATIAVAGSASLIAETFRLPSAGPVIYLLALAIPLIVTSDILLVAIRFTRQMRFEVYARSIAEPITLSLTAILVYKLGASEYGLVISYLASLVVAALSTIFFFSRVFPFKACLRLPLEWPELKRLIRFSTPTAGYELLTQAGDQIDVLLVSYFSPAHVVGIYGMARQFATFTRKVRQGFDRILPPVLSDAVITGDLNRVGSQVAIVSRWILSVQVLLILGFAWFADNVLGLLGGDFSAGAVALVLLLVGDTINGSLGVNELPIIYLKPAINFFIGILRLLLVVGLGFWLVQEFSIEGIAIAVAAAYLVSNAARILFNRYAFKIRTLTPGIGKPVLAAIPAVGLAALSYTIFQELPLAREIVTPVVLLGVYLVALLKLGLEPQEQAQIQALLERRSRRKQPAGS